MKGTLALVNIGPYSFDAVLEEGSARNDGSNLYVPVRSVAALFLLPQNNASRDLKAILGEQYSCLKIQVKDDGHNVRENTCISITQFELVLRRLDRKGNRVAQELGDYLVGLGLV